MALKDDRVEQCLRSCGSDSDIDEFNFIYDFDTWLTVMFRLFLNALCKWNVTKANYCVILMSLANKYPCIIVNDAFNSKRSG